MNPSETDVAERKTPPASPEGGADAAQVFLHDLYDFLNNIHLQLLVLEQSNDPAAKEKLTRIRKQIIEFSQSAKQFHATQTERSANSACTLP